MDLIDREQAIKAIEDLQDCYNGFSDTYDKACIIGVLEELPSVEKTGRWIKEPNCMFRCSLCGDHYPSITGYMRYKFCPNCAARMVSDESAD